MIASTFIFFLPKKTYQPPAVNHRDPYGKVWDDVELDLPMESPQLAAATAISCAHTLVRRRSRTSLGGAKGF